MKNNIKHIIYERILSKLFFMSTCLLILFTFATLIPMLCKGEQTAEAVGEALGSSLTLDVQSNVASADLSSLTPEQQAQLKDGILIKSSPINFSVTTNHYSGYKLFINAKDDNKTLFSGEHNIDSIIPSLTEDQFNTAQYNNMWGYKFNNGNYLPSPATAATILDHTTTSGNNDYSLSFAARINHETPVGVYSKNLTLSTVVNPTPYLITYNANTTDPVSNMPTAQSGETTENTITLSSQAPTREGYVFTGWCSSETESQDYTVVCKDNYFMNGANLGIDQTTSNNTTLYAIWLDEYMQNFTEDNCKNYATNNPLYLYDKRDNKEYSVRYINGSCFMTRNLSFELTTGMTLDASTTNLRGLAEGETVSLGVVRSDGGEYTYTEAGFIIPSASDLAKTGLSAKENGYWYNYCAASAGQICTAYADSEATIDICPTKWSMPGFSEWDLISGGDISTNPYIEAFAPVEAGLYYAYTIYSVPGHGFWWSKTIVPSNKVQNYRLIYFGSGAAGELRAESSASRELSISIRCILSE